MPISVWTAATAMLAAASIMLAAAAPPGALNPGVTQANIRITVCVPGWTKTVRPPVAFTDAIKRRRMAAGHLPGRAEDYELDHWIPLELGGAPRDERNLVMQDWSMARLKDAEETRLHRLVCEGRMTLDQARGTIRRWVPK